MSPAFAYRCSVCGPDVVYLAPQIVVLGGVAYCNVHFRYALEAHPVPPPQGGPHA